MIRYATGAVPWGRVGLAACLVWLLMELVRRWPWTMWPLEGAAVGLLAGATAWCFDEASAAVVDAAPRGLAWRSTARAAGPLVLLATWCTAVYVARGSLFEHPWHVLGQGVAAMVAAAGWCTWWRASGEPSPGSSLALAVVPLATAWALVRPLSELLPVFPYADGSGEFGSWGTSAWLWCALAGCGVALLAAGLTDVRWRTPTFASSTSESAVTAGRRAGTPGRPRPGTGRR